jgi:hypothetical protein
MRLQKHKSQILIEYKSSTWKTEIKGDLNNPKVKILIIADFILRWTIRILFVALTAYKLISHNLP